MCTCIINDIVIAQQDASHSPKELIIFLQLLYRVRKECRISNHGRKIDIFSPITLTSWGFITSESIDVG
jgi:hypothetical protein